MGKMGLETPGKHPPIPNLALCAKNKPLKGNVSFQKNTFFILAKGGFYFRRNESIFLANFIVYSMETIPRCKLESETFLILSSPPIMIDKV